MPYTSIDLKPDQLALLRRRYLTYHRYGIESADIKALTDTQSKMKFLQHPLVALEVSIW